MELKDQVAIVTGSTSGMGEAIVRRLSAHGASVVLHGRKGEKGRSLRDTIVGQGGKAIFVEGDISQDMLCDTLVDEAISNFGRLDIVVANAGMLGLGNLLDLDPAVWRETFDVNVTSVFRLLQKAIPQMQRTGGGTIVVNSSIAAFKAFPNHPAYCASKAAVVALTRQVALDFGPQIRANVICPGPVDTPFIWDSAVAFPDPAVAVQNAGKKTVMKRLGLPEDISELVLFLVSSRSSWMTGSVITIDGGVTVS